MEDMPEALGRPYLEYWAPSREVLMRDTARAWAGETVSVRGARFTVFRNGGPVDAWYDYGFSPVVDETGRVVGVLNTGIDITAQMRAEAQLRDSEARWRGLFRAHG
jgi:PAS domain-containing protein